MALASANARTAAAERSAASASAAEEVAATGAELDESVVVGDLGDEKARFTSPKLRPEEAHAAPPPVFGSGADAKGSADGFAPDWRAASMRSQERIQNYVCVSAVDLLRQTLVRQLSATLSLDPSKSLPEEADSLMSDDRVLRSVRCRAHDQPAATRCLH